jgi:hypothetical protein
MTLPLPLPPLTAVYAHALVLSGRRQMLSWPCVSLLPNRNLYLYKSDVFVGLNSSSTAAFNA